MIEGNGPPLHPKAGETSFFVKVTPGTQLYNQVLMINSIKPGVTRQKCVRLMAEAGFTACWTKLMAEAENGSQP